MNAKSFIKIGLFGVSITAVNIGSAFGWKCSLGEKHNKFEVCQATYDRFCDKCKVVHFGWNVCPQTVFLIPGEDCKIVRMPSGTEDTEIVELQVRYGYGEDGKKINSANSFSSMRDKAEISRLSRFVHALEKKYLPKKVKGKKRGNRNLELHGKGISDSSCVMNYKKGDSGFLQKKRLKKGLPETLMEKKRKDNEIMRRFIFGKESKGEIESGSEEEK